MGETKGMLWSILIFTAFILPAMLSIFMLSVRTEHFLRATSEITQAVEGYGGATTEFYDEYKDLEIYGNKLAIKSNQDGKVEPGTTITLTYEYSYEGFYQMNHEMYTQDTITIYTR